MATTKGSSGVVKLAVSGGSVAAMGEIRSFTLDETADTIEDSVMGDTSRTYVSSLKTATLSMDVYWDDADAVQLVMDAAADLDFELYPTGTGTGEKYYSGSGHSMVWLREVSLCKYLERLQKPQHKESQNGTS